ncbi:MAG TPA: DNA-directed RNA polymerase subunit alpha [Candidatus Woesebacteria bacterium]|nr:DNA-directed RNA polymerase subunit alpha [Candidatus Woesebacteria bacterium]
MTNKQTWYTYENPTFAITEEKKTASHSLFTFKPLENGYGHTIGNALRRVLLSSLPGAAITAVNIEGVDHQFTTVAGVKEDVVELLLNLKQVRILADSADDLGIARVEIQGPATVTAADIKCEAGFTVVNPDLHLASLAQGAKLQMEMKIQSGIGYQLSELVEQKEIGELTVDAIFSPVLTVSYKVESTRVGRRTDYDKLLLDVKTDGTINPREAVEKAAQILTKQFAQVFEPVVVEEVTVAEDVSPEKAEVLRLTVEELDLPTRIANALRKGGYKTVGDLVNSTRGAVERVKNIGEKSAGIVDEALQKKGVTLSN